MKIIRTRWSGPGETQVTVGSERNEAFITVGGVHQGKKNHSSLEWPTGLHAEIVKPSVNLTLYHRGQIVPS